LQIGAQRKAGVGDNAVGPFSKRRDDAQEGRLGRMQKRVVRLRSQTGNDPENLFTLSGKIDGDLRRKAIEPMAGHADLNHQAGPRRRA
jgi:hypothetical protein